MNSPVLQKSFELLSKTNTLKKFIGIHIISILLNIFERQCVILLDKTSNSLLLVFGLFIIINMLYEKLFEEIQINKILNLTIKPEFIKSTLCEYNEFSYTYKNKNTYSTFNNKANQAMWAIYSILDWGVPCIKYLVINIISIIWITILDKMYWFIITFIILNILYYVIILKKTFQNIKKEVKGVKDELEKIDEYHQLISPLFQKKNISISQMETYSKQKLEMQFTMDCIWLKLHKKIGLIKIVNILILLLFIYMLDVQNKIIIISFFYRMESSLNQLYYFLNRYTKFDSDYDLFIKIINNSDCSKDELQYDIPSTITITTIDINKSNLKLSLDTKTKYPIHISLGNKILITGYSGSGKTTLIDAFVGLINGITFEGPYQPVNLYSNFVIMYQSIRADIPTSKVNIIELFTIENSHEFNLEICKKACNICCINEWLSKRLDNLEKTIDEEISGGEKSRLIMAIKIYTLLIDNKKILILDEPEQGSDPLIAYKIIDNLFNEFNDITIIIISHLEKIKINYKWDKTINITKGNTPGHNLINIL